MAAGVYATANTAIVHDDLVQLSPIVWLDAAEVAAEQYQPVMDLMRTDQLDQFNREYSSFANGGFGNVITEGADYENITHSQGDAMILTQRKRGRSYTITEDLMDGNKYPEIESHMRDLGELLFRTRARDVSHHLFRFSFAATYVDASGATVTNGVANQSTEPIFDDTHTMATGDTYDNELADTSLAEVALRNLHDLTTAFVDEDGFRVPWGVSGEKVLVTSNNVATVHVAQRLTTQEWQIDSASRNVNLFRGQFRHLPLFFIETNAAGNINATAAFYYWILDPNLMKRLAIFGDHTKPKLTGPFEDMFNGGMLWRAKTRFDMGVQAAHIGAGCPATS